MKSKYWGVCLSVALVLCLFALPTLAFAWDDSVGPAMSGGSTAFTGTIGATTDNSSSTMKMPTVKVNNFGYGMDGSLFGGTYTYNLTCESCHNYTSTVKAHRNCIICHGDSTGAGFIPSMMAKNQADPTFWSTVSACSDCHDGTIAALPHGNTPQAVYDVHAMDTKSIANSCGPTTSTFGSNPACHIRNLVAEHRNVQTRYQWDSALGKAQRVETGRQARGLDCTSCHKKDANGVLVLSSSSGSYDFYDGTSRGQCVDCHPDSHMMKDSANYNKMLAVHTSEAPMQVWSESASGGPRLVVGDNAILAHGITYVNGLIQIPDAPNTGTTWGCSAANMCHNKAFEAAASLNMYDAVRASRFQTLGLSDLQHKIVTCGNPYGNAYCHYGAAKPTTSIVGEYIAMDNGSMNRDGKPGYDGSGQWYNGGTFLPQYNAYLTLDLSGQSIASGTKLQFKNSYYFQDTVGAANSPAATDATKPDYGKVQVRVGGTGDWADLWTVSGEGYAWSYKTIDLSAYAGQSIEIRWASLGNADQYNGWGWQLADISLRDAADTVTYQVPLDVTQAPWSKESNYVTTTTQYDPDLDADVVVATTNPLPATYGFFSTVALPSKLITTDSTGKIIAVAPGAFNSATGVLDLYTDGGEAATSLDPQVLKTTSFIDATTVILPPTLQTIPDGMLANKPKVTMVGTPDTVGLGVLSQDFGLTNLTTIGANAFNGSGISGSLVLSPNVASIGKSAFVNTKLTSVRIAWLATSAPAQAATSKFASLMNASPTGTSIGESAFEGLTTLKTAEIGSGVNSIGAYAFRNTGITTLTFQDPMSPNMTIGQAAFWVPTFNQFTATPVQLDIATNAGTTMNYIFNNPNNSIPASSDVTIALIVIAGLAMGGYSMVRSRKKA